MHTDKELRLWERIIQSRYRMGRLRPRHIALAEKSGIVWRDAGANFMPFIEARSLARAQHFTNVSEFSKWKKPKGMPSHPNATYVDSGWLGWKDFLGTEFMSFAKARVLARAQHFTNKKGFLQWKKPKGMPCSPHVKYADSGWINWGDFLGTGNVHEKDFMSFIKARVLARAQHFSNLREFNNWKKPEGMPSNPNKIYADSGWLGYGDFLGNKKGKDNAH
jgi:hypothetical protein